jgi:peptide/nickel transport system substrate-binding protein
MQQGGRVVLEVNPHASKPPVYFRRVVLKTVRDETERLMQLGKGDVDLVDGVAPDRLGWLRSRPGIRVESGVPRTVSFLQLNNERKPLNDVRVRRAISLAIDREQILNRVIRGGGALVHGVLPPGVPGHDPSLPLPTYDPAAARRLLSEAGVTPGTKLVLTVASDAESGPGSPSVLALQEQLGRVGLDVELRQITQGARAELFRGNFDLALQSIQLDFPDPWIMFTFLYDSRLMGTMGDMARYRNPALEQKLAEADNTPDPERRAELYRDAQRMVVNDMPNVPLYQPGWHVALRDDIDGLRYDYSQLLFINAQDMRRSASTAGKEH